MCSAVLVDDHAIIRRGFTEYLETAPNLTVWAAAERAETALQLLEERRPDVVVTDFALPGIDGLEFTRRITNRWSETSVLMVSNRSKATYGPKARAAGAKGYLSKTAVTDQLIPAVRQVARGQSLRSGKINKEAR